MEMEKIYDRIYRYSFYKVRDRAAAEDITQETFLRFFTHNRKISRGEDMAYLYTIARNLCTDHFRERSSEKFYEELSDGGFSHVFDTKIAVRAAMDRLEERQREAVALRYIAGLSVGETASVMGISRFAVYRLESAALGQMKNYLKGAL